MTRWGFIAALLVGVIALAGAVAVAEDGSQTGVAGAASRSPQVVPEKSPRAIQLLITSQLVASGDYSRIVTPSSFCAPPNGEPVALACGGPVRAPEGPKVPVQPGRPILLRLGTAADRVSVRYERATERGRVMASTYSLPVASSSNSGLAWKTVMPEDRSLRRSGSIAVFSVVYREGIQLALPNRMTKPFEKATAEFAVPLRPLGIYTRRENRKWAEAELLGLSEAEAEARARGRGLLIRVLRRNKRAILQTEDRVVTRINVEVVDGRVTRVIGLF